MRAPQPAGTEIDTYSKKLRMEYLNRNGFSQIRIETKKGEEIRKILKERDREVQAQMQDNRIRNSVYNFRYKFIRYCRKPEYLMKRDCKENQRLELDVGTWKNTTDIS